MSKILVVLASLFCFVLFERGPIKLFVVEYIESVCGCKFIGAEFFLPFKLHAGKVVAQNVIAEGVWIKVGFDGIHYVSAENVRVDYSTSNEPLTREDLAKLSQSVDEVVQKFAFSGAFVPNKVKIRTLSVGAFNLRKIYMRRCGGVINAAFNTDFGDAKDVDMKLAVNLPQSTIMLDASCELFGQYAGFYSEGTFSRFSMFNLSRASVFYNDGKYDFSGVVDMGQQLVKVQYRWFTATLLHDSGEISVNVDGAGFVLNAHTNLKDFKTDFALKHADDVITGVYKDGAISAKSRSFMGIQNIVFSVADGKLSGMSSVDETKIELGGNYKRSDFGLDINLKKLNFISKIGRGRLKNDAYIIVGKHGVNWKFPMMDVDSPTLKTSFGAQYIDGALVGWANVQKLKLNKDFNYIGRVNFDNKANPEYVSVKARLDSVSSKVKIDSGEYGTDIKISLQEASRVTAHIPLRFLANNRLYSFDSAGTRVGLNLNTPIAALFQQENVKGDIKTNLSFKINKDSVDITGDLDFKHGLILFPRFGVVLKGIRIHADADHDALRVTYGKMYDVVGGSADLSGEIRFKPNDVLADLKFAFENMCLSSDGALNMIGTGIVTAVGALSDKIKIEGEVDCSKSSFKMMAYQNEYQDIEITHVYENLIRSESGGLPFKLLFNILLKCPDLRIYGSMLDTLWEGDLTLCGENLSTLSGVLRVKKGKLQLFKKDFATAGGKIKFKKDYPFNPILFLQAIRTSGDMTVDIKISKSIEKADLRISSIPERSIEDILARLLFDKNAKDMSATDWAQVGYITQISQPGSPLQKVDELISRFGVTDIRLDKKNGAAIGTISVSKKLHDKVYVSVEDDIDEKSPYMKVKVDLTDKITASVSSKGEVGADYKVRY